MPVHISGHGLPPGCSVGFKTVSVRALTASYLIALLIIAGLSIATHVMLDVGLRSDEGSAAIINLTGRQRMLSQRIAGLAAEYAMGDATARADLLTAIAAFETAHDTLLLDTRTAPQGSAAARALNQIYFATPGGLDAQVRNFVAEARRVTDMKPQDPGMQSALASIFAEARAPLLHGLESVVRIHQEQSEARLLDLEYLQWSILAVVLLTLTAEAMVIFRPMIRRIITYTSELIYLATTDPLTGAANRRSFVDKANAEVERARRYDRPLSVVMLDIDRFKSINDSFGHAAGDAVLKALCAALREDLRPTDILGRLGGEEFAILLVETAPAAAAVLADRMREKLADTVVEFREHRMNFTASFGVAPLVTETQGLEEALRVADSRLYEAKRGGRNRTVSERPLQVAPALA